MKPVITPKNPDDTVQLRPGVDFTKPGQRAPWDKPVGQSDAQNQLNALFGLDAAQAIQNAQGNSQTLREAAERQRAASDPWSPSQWPLGRV